MRLQSEVSVTNGSVSSSRLSHSAQQKVSEDSRVSCLQVSIQHFPVPRQKSACVERC